MLAILWHIDSGVKDSHIDRPECVMTAGNRGGNGIGIAHIGSITAKQIGCVFYCGKALLASGNGADSVPVIGEHFCQSRANAGAGPGDKMMAHDQLSLWCYPFLVLNRLAFSSLYVGLVTAKNNHFDWWVNRFFGQRHRLNLDKPIWAKQSGQMGLSR
jgi:hypothetical protein